MSEVISIRKNQPYLIGQKVRIGNSESTFDIVGFGEGGPDLNFVANTNASEFLVLKVPGHEYGVFSIHNNFVNQVESP